MHKYGWTLAIAAEIQYYLYFKCILGSQFPETVSGDLKVTFDDLPEDGTVEENIKTQVESYVMENLDCAADSDKCSVNVQVKTSKVFL